MGSPKAVSIRRRGGGTSIFSYMRRFRTLFWVQNFRAAKRKYFTEFISNSKDTKHIWAHLRTVNGDTKASSKYLPKELTIGNNFFPKSEDIAHKLNSYFTSIAIIINVNDSDTPALNTEQISKLVENKVPADTFFTTPLITSEQVST